MYNEVTAREIAESPPLDGLDLIRLPAQLTEAFTRIVAYRMIAGDDDAVPNQRLSDLLVEISRLAETYETLFLANCLDEETARHAGFVSATAYALLARHGEPRHRSELFTEAGVSPLISAVLLFVSSGYYADACEFARHHFLLDDAENFNNSLAKAVASLASGDPLPVETAETGNVDDSLISQAVHQLYRNCIKAISRADEYLRSGSDAARHECISRLAEVTRLARFTFEVSGRSVHSVFGGPLQFARLLDAATRKLTESSVFTVPAPLGVSADRWRIFVGRLAEGRPTIWDQHRDILRRGLLEIGSSAVLSIPTGAGKTALAELKIATYILTGRKVVYLAPTHALEAQITARMMALFGDDARGLVGDASEMDDELPSVTVCTPEACLTFLSLSPERFSAVGLFILDECHILHADSIETDTARRALDSMFCILEAHDVAAGADFLLMSAMVRNVSQLAAWLESISGRRCLAISDLWKPTRQARGCVVYPQASVDHLTARVTDRYNATTTDNPPANLRASLSIRPYALFSLVDNWTRSVQDFILLELLNEDVRLSVGGKRSEHGRWWLSPNRNDVAASLAKRTGELGIKTLVFCGDVKSTSTVAEKSRGVGRTGTELTDEENALFEELVLEFGSAECLYYVPGAVTGVHHSLLLRQERELIEQVFKRDSGLNVLAATPTLAQGLNLPAEIVIIAGDDRYDPTAENPADRQRLEAHELLNAAGRAGRAGHFSQGVVLVIPGRIVGLNESDYRVSPRWLELQEQFASADQCLDIVDPFSVLLDAIDSGQVSTPNVKYSLLRIYPHSGSEPMFRRRLEKSLWAFCSGREAAEGLIDAAVACIAQMDLPDVDNFDPALVEMARKSGLALGWLQSILLRIIESADDLSAYSVADWVGWVINLGPFLLMLSDETIDKAKKYGSDDTEDSIRSLIRSVTLAWIEGKQLIEIERLFSRPTSRVPPKCQRTRLAVLKWLPEIAYIVGLIRSLFEIALTDVQVPIPLQVLSRCLRLGLNSPEKLAFMHVRGYGILRVACHREFRSIEARIEMNTGDTNFRDVITRVVSAVENEEA